MTYSRSAGPPLEVHAQIISAIKARSLFSYAKEPPSFMPAKLDFTDIAIKYVNAQLYGGSERGLK